MNGLFDILLPRPISAAFYHIAMFVFFSLHLFFVLLMLGAAFFGAVSMIRRLRPADGDAPRSAFPVYFASKSVAINFGVAVLLLAAVFHSVPFAGSAALNAPLMLSIVLLLVAAFVLLEIADARVSGGRGAAAWGFAGALVLLLVPGIFAAFVVTAENPERWAEIFRRGVILSTLGPHWLARWLHLLGAAVVIAAAVFTVLPAKAFARLSFARGALFGALMVQMLLGIVLYMTLPRSPGLLPNLFVAAGAAWAFGLAWRLCRCGAAAAIGRGALCVSVLFIFIPMLLSRHLLQRDALAPFAARLEKNAGERRDAVAKSAPGTGNLFLREEYWNYNLPQFIFQKSCSFCHGAVGNGKGIEAENLRIPPYDLTAIRTDPETLLAVLHGGVPGTAMPTFGIYTADSLKGLIGYLRGNVGIRSELERVPVAVEPGEARAAAGAYLRRCAACHGADGVAVPGQKEPRPRDMTVWALEPRAEFDVISRGYPGTSMQGYPEIPERERWALVERAYGFYRGPRE